MRQDDVIKKKKKERRSAVNDAVLQRPADYGYVTSLHALFCFFVFLLILTRLVGGYVDGGVARRDGALGRDAVDGLDLEAVVRVSLKVPDGCVSLSEAQAAWRDLHVVVAAHAGAVLALLTHHVIHEVGAASGVARLRPLQKHGRLVYAGDHAERG